MARREFMVTYVCECGCGEEFEAPWSLFRKYKDKKHARRASVKNWYHKSREGKPDRRRNENKLPGHYYPAAVPQTGRYPANWKTLAIKAKERAAWTCEHCGMKFIPVTGKAVDARDVRGRPIVLTVHHLNGNKSDCSPDNLLACCFFCHGEVQRLWAPGLPLPDAWPEPPAWMLERRLAYAEK